MSVTFWLIMKWATKCQDLGLLLLSICWLVDGILGAKRNRADAEQEPFETVILDAGDGPSSALFSSCLSASRTLEVKLYSIEIPETSTEFMRYAPDSTQLIVPPTWETVTGDPPVSSTLDCAEAAYSGGNAMFKYSGGSDCKVSNQTYDTNYVPVCEAEDQDAVFISNAASAACPLPAIPLLEDSDGSTVSCITINTDRMSYNDAADWCSSNGGQIFDGPAGLIGYDDIVTILTDLNIDRNTNFFLEGWLTYAWIWADSLISVNETWFAGDISTTNDDMMIISGAADFMIDFTPWDTFMGGAVCIERGVEV